MAKRTISITLSEWDLWFLDAMRDLHGSPQQTLRSCLRRRWEEMTDAEREAWHVTFQDWHGSEQFGAFTDRRTRRSEQSARRRRRRGLHLVK